MSWAVWQAKEPEKMDSWKLVNRAIRGLSVGCYWSWNTFCSAFSALELPVGRISRDSCRRYFQKCIRDRLDRPDITKSLNLGWNVARPPKTVQPVIHSILSTYDFFSGNVKWIQVTWYPERDQRWRAKEPEKIANNENSPKSTSVYVSCARELVQPSHELSSQSNISSTPTRWAARDISY